MQAKADSAGFKFMHLCEVLRLDLLRLKHGTSTAAYEIQLLYRAF